jgi:hypothetical protein
MDPSDPDRFRAQTRSVFVKGAKTARTAVWLHNEREPLAAAPEAVAWIDDGDNASF